MCSRLIFCLLSSNVLRLCIVPLKTAIVRLCGSGGIKKDLRELSEGFKEFRNAQKPYETYFTDIDIWG